MADKTKLKTPGPTKPCPPNKMTDRSIREFTKTAEAISKSPWNMKEAASYLLMWCEANKSGEIPNPVPPGWVVSTQNSIVLWKDRPLETEWQKYAPGKPAPIQVAERGGGRGGGALCCAGSCETPYPQRLSIAPSGLEVLPMVLEGLKCQVAQDPHPQGLEGPRRGPVALSGLEWPRMPLRSLEEPCCLEGP
eukprot:2436577-Pyramimonas_sp.AAC.1